MSKYTISTMPSQGGILYTIRDNNPGGESTEEYYHAFLKGDHADCDGDADKCAAAKCQHIRAARKHQESIAA